MNYAVALDSPLAPDKNRSKKQAGPDPVLDDLARGGDLGMSKIA